MSDEVRGLLYNASWVAGYFDQFGVREWERLVATPVAEVSFYLHSYYLKKYIRPGSRVLEIGAGAGRFTQVLAGLGARLVVADISAGQLALNRQHASQYGFAGAVESWQEVDVCAMSGYTEAEFEAVVAYGGPLSYVLDRRDQALQECIRVLKPGGLLFLSVMSLWGTAHERLNGVLGIPVADNQRITASGDVLPGSFPGSRHFMHMFRAGELRDWLMGAGLEVVAMSASGCLCPGWNELLQEQRADEEKWAELLRLELEASAEPESLNMGTHIIAITLRTLPKGPMDCYSGV
jgi:SAM-dependent methyltransferase